MDHKWKKRVGISEEVVIKACSLAVQSHKSGRYVKKDDKGHVSFGFPGSWSVQDFYATDGKPFGETLVDVKQFRSIKTIGSNEVAKVNEASFKRFQAILESKSFKDEVKKAVEKDKLVVFTGHSSGGPLAILATVWCLETYCSRSGDKDLCKCITFGSPLVGDRIFTHALNREDSARHFIHFVGRYDIVPRIMLAPLSTIEKEFCRILDFLKSTTQKHPTTLDPTLEEAFFENVLTNALSVASHAACNVMRNTNPLLETISSIVELSPYRPSGTYVFCTGKGKKLVCSSNSDAVLQILFYCCQPKDEADVKDAARKSLHVDYNIELKESLTGKQDVVYLDDEVDIPFSSNGTVSENAASINTALNDLGLSTSARLCLAAVKQFEKEKLENEKSMDLKIPKIKNWQNKIAKYQKDCKDNKIGYYDAFKIQNRDHDFNANVTRLELAGIWDEVMEMLKRYELPDGFESRDEWIKLGTEFRRLVEPLDIANYYRHSKDEDTGKYLKEGGRPTRYRYTQRWLEHAQKLEEGSSSDSTFLAKVEDMRRKPFNEIEEQILVLEKEVDQWVKNKELGEDVFFKESTFALWWYELPQSHRSKSCLKTHFENSAH